MAQSTALLQVTPPGLYCAAADVYLDPWQPVSRALITHGHSDHARYGMGEYLCTEESVPILKHRLGPDISARGLKLGESLNIRGVTFSFHPAGHVPGSAQIRVEYKGEVWVYSGDYKTEADGVTPGFEPVRCNTFISECTFGLPIFRWRPQSEVFAGINEWWRSNFERGINSVLLGYSLGKAQRILQHLDGSIGPVVLHGSIRATSDVLGFSLEHLRTEDWTTSQRPVLVVAPPAVHGSAALKRFQPHSVAAASGWMNVRGMKRRRGIETGFVLSDHADFEQLQAAIRATGAERVLLTHGYTATFSRFIQERGLDAAELKTGFDPIGEENE
jgi:putative mRNA 3-end processing factor